MKHICGTIFRLKQLLEVALQLDDAKMRKVLSAMLNDLDKAVAVVECLEDDSIQKLELKKKEFNYII